MDEKLKEILEVLKRIEVGQRAIIDGLGMICHNTGRMDSAGCYYQFTAEELLSIENNE